MRGQKLGAKALAATEAANSPAARQYKSLVGKRVTRKAESGMNTARASA